MILKVYKNRQNIFKTSRINLKPLFIFIIYHFVRANSANTNCCHFQVRINCLKFIIDVLQQRCCMTLLVSLFVTSRNLWFGVFLPRKIIAILQKITINAS